MPIIQNTTNHAIPVVISGSRKTIKPGQILNGPQALLSIPGLQLVQSEKKIIIPDAVNKRVEDVMSSETSVQPTPPEKVSVNFEFIQTQEDTLETESKFNSINTFLKEYRDRNDVPSVTIGILTKNQYQLVVDCCESIFNKVQYKNVTLFIIDTGSNDQNVRNYYKLLPQKCADKNWTYQFMQIDHYHFSQNYNSAARQVKTDYFLIQNNDTVALNDYVSQMMVVAINQKVGSVGTRMLYKDGSIQHDGQFIYNGPNGQISTPGHLHLRVKPEQLNDQQNFGTHLVDGNTAAGVLMKTSEYIAIGGIDEGYKDIFQDVDLMMKITPMLGKFNYCSRDANIIHIDNATRLMQGHDPKRAAAMWEDTHYLKDRVVKNNWIYSKKQEPVDFSFITLVRDTQKYNQFLTSLSQQMGANSYEVIPIPNYFNQINSAFRGLNIGQDISNGKYLIFCHDDIILSNNWIERLKYHIRNLENNSIQWGVLGPAGITIGSEQGAYFLTTETGENIKIKDSSVINDKEIYEVGCLDELCLITKKSTGLRFSDRELSGFHFYGGNLCLESKRLGLRNFAIDCWTFHQSDGNKNVSSKEKFDLFYESAKTFQMWSMKSGITSWRTTTTKCSGPRQEDLMIFIDSPV